MSGRRPLTRRSGWHTCLAKRSSRAPRRAVAVKSGRLGSTALIEAVIAGRSEEVRGHAEALQLDPDLVATLLRFVLFPQFTALAAQLAPLREGSAWPHGFCPTCGSWPLLG